MSAAFFTGDVTDVSTLPIPGQVLAPLTLNREPEPRTPTPDTLNPESDTKKMTTETRNPNPEPVTPKTEFTGDVTEISSLPISGQVCT